MKRNCFTRIIAEKQVGNFEAGYEGLDFLQAESSIFTPRSKNDFYNEIFIITKSFRFLYQPGKVLGQNPSGQKPPTKTPG